MLIFVKFLLNNDIYKSLMVAGIILGSWLCNYGLIDHGNIGIIDMMKLMISSIRTYSGSNTKTTEPFIYAGSLTNGLHIAENDI